MTNLPKVIYLVSGAHGLRSWPVLAMGSTLAADAMVRHLRTLASQARSRSKHGCPDDANGAGIKLVALDPAIGARGWMDVRYIVEEVPCR